MSDTEHGAFTPASLQRVHNNVPDLIDDCRRRRKALETQAQELADLQTEILALAHRQADDIIAGARADICRTIMNARQELLSVAEQIRSIAAHRIEADDSSAGTTAAGSEWGGAAFVLPP